jgi:hypothetical protein
VTLYGDGAVFNPHSPIYAPDSQVDVCVSCGQHANAPIHDNYRRSTMSEYISTTDAYYIRTIRTNGGAEYAVVEATTDHVVAKCDGKKDAQHLLDLLLAEQDGYEPLTVMSSLASPETHIHIHLDGKASADA